MGKCNIFHLYLRDLWQQNKKKTYKQTRHYNLIETLHQQTEIRDHLRTETPHLCLTHTSFKLCILSHSGVRVHERPTRSHVRRFAAPTTRLTVTVREIMRHCPQLYVELYPLTADTQAAIWAEVTVTQRFKMHRCNMFVNVTHACRSRLHFLLISSISDSSSSE